jgi:hypothetical protein
MINNPVVWFKIYVQDLSRAKYFYESVFQVKLEQLNNPDQATQPATHGNFLNSHMVIFIVVMILTLLSPPALAGAMDDQSDTIGTCIRATELFEKQELAKGNKSAEPGSLSASCKDKDQLKSATYWQCMEKRAKQEIDINTAHSQCGVESKKAE